MVNPAKVPSVKLQGALAFLDYMTSAEFQTRLNSYPNTQQQAFFPDAFPLDHSRGAVPGPSGRAAAHPRGIAHQPAPGTGPLAGAPLAIDASLGISGSPFGPLSPGFRTLRRGKTGANGVYSLTAAPAATARSASGHRAWGRSARPRWYSGMST